MDSKKVFQNLANYSIGFIVLMLITGCTIGRVYVGSELQGNPSEKLVSGQTTKSQVLDILGPQISSNDNMTETYFSTLIYGEIIQSSQSKNRS